MKTLIAILIFGASFPIHAHESIGHFNNRKAYKSQKGYAYENKCFHYEYREQYIPGNSISPGYVKFFNEKVSIPCNAYRKVFRHYHQQSLPQTSYVKYKKYKTVHKCTGSSTLGGLIGGGIAASISNNDAYAWSIPLGAVLGAGIGNAECK
tara:strand:+ start:764 stop:1216 length:453 start_codon:yes stop_codon:yes gene_type:complete